MGMCTLKESSLAALPLWESVSSATSVLHGKSNVSMTK